jgi:small-conductance mechanosensitive channel
MDEQNPLPDNNVPPATPPPVQIPVPMPMPPVPMPVHKKHSGLETFLGIIVGTLQPFIVLILVGTVSVSSSIWSIPYMSFLVYFLPLILEAIFLHKKFPNFVKGAVIGTILVPVIGFGLCFLMFAGLGSGH